MFYKAKPYAFIAMAVATLPLAQGNKIGVVSALLLLGCGAAILHMRNQYRKTTRARIR